MLVCIPKITNPRLATSGQGLFVSIRARESSADKQKIARRSWPSKPFLSAKTYTGGLLLINVHGELNPGVNR